MPGARNLNPAQLEKLTRVKQCRRKSDDARSLLVESIRDASAAGCSLRAISEAAGMSYQRVHQILRGE